MPVAEYSVDWMKFLVGVFPGHEWSDIYSKSVRNPARDNNKKFLLDDAQRKNLVIFGSICSENISPYLFGNAVRSGSTVLINIASHAPFNGSPLLSRQTVAVNSVRALENGRYFIRASNYDKSYIISDVGTFQNSIDSGDNTYAVLNSKIKTVTYITPYVQFGDYILYISLIILFASFIFF